MIAKDTIVKTHLKFNSTINMLVLDGKKYSCFNLELGPVSNEAIGNFLKCQYLKLGAWTGFK